MKLIILFVATFVVVGNTGSPIEVLETRANQAELVDYIGMSGDGVRKMQSKINELLRSNPSNDVLAKNLYNWSKNEDTRYNFLATIHQCQDACFTGAMPSMYAIFKIDRGTTTVMVSGRQKC